METLFITLTELIANAHLWHFQTFNEPEHRTLGKLYEGTQDIMDSIIEQWMGKNDNRIRVTTANRIELVNYSTTSDIVNRLDKIVKLLDLEASRYGLDIQNTILDMKNLINVTKYKLTFV